MHTSHSPPLPGPRIVVVGPCAAGKTTLVNGLRRHGFEALVCGQEHSDVPYLWRRTSPGVVIALAITLPAIRRRRDDANWPAWLFERQQHRLRQAVAAASVVIDTSEADAATVLDQALAHLSRLPDAA